MRDKSYVTMEQQQCPVCLEIHDTGALLMHKRMGKVFSPKTLTGWGLCPHDKARSEQGMLAMVETSDAHNVTLHSATRTGRVMYIRREAAKAIFSISIGDVPMAFISVDAFNKLMEKYRADTGDEVPFDTHGSSGSDGDGGRTRGQQAANDGPADAPTDNDHGQTGPGSESIAVSGPDTKQ